MTSNQDTKNFVQGLAIISKYMNEESSLSVIEVSSISVCQLDRIPAQDLEALKALDWNAGKDKDGGSWAEYFKLEYVDT
jgi:hypothetical protein